MAQSFQELRSECANISALMEKMVKLQMHVVKTQKSSLTELKDLNKGPHNSEKGDFTRRQNESVAVS
jgi:hypothetical protein